MSICFRRTPKGKIEASFRPGPCFVLVSKTLRVVDDFRMDILHFIAPDLQQCWYTLSGIQLNMLNNHPRANCQFGLSGGGRATSTRFRWEGKVYLVIPKISNTDYIHLVNPEGKLLAGSNIHGSGSLCLGMSPNPFIMDGLDALLMNKANNDLGWRGSNATGTWKTNIFHASQWPVSDTIVTIPEEIRAATAMWPDQPPSNDP